MHRDLLRISERAIRRAAHDHGQGFNLPLIAVRQAVSEAWVRAIRKASFRSSANDRALQGYGAMSAREFMGVNARQRWANWRTIPRNLHLACPARPLRCLDLCCGTGDSTQVLAWHLPVGSRILGLEYQPAFVAQAAGRRYPHAGGSAARVAFRAQSVLETFCDEDGTPIADGSIDLVNSSGAVGCHFTPDATRTLAREIARVLAPSGLALIDAGEAGTPAGVCEEIFGALGFVRRRAVRSCWLDRYAHLCFARAAASASPAPAVAASGLSVR